MKISAFNPRIVTTHSDDAIRLFEELGFEVRHEKKESFNPMRAEAPFFKRKV